MQRVGKIGGPIGGPIGGAIRAASKGFTDEGKSVEMQRLGKIGGPISGAIQAASKGFTDDGKSVEMQRISRFALLSDKSKKARLQVPYHPCHPLAALPLFHP